MTIFNDLWNSTGEQFLTEYFPVGFTYVDSSLSSPVELTTGRASRENQERRPIKQTGGWELVTTRTIEIQRLSNITFLPNGTVVIEDKKYTVSAVNSIEGDCIELKLTRAQIGELTRPNYRN